MKNSIIVALAEGPFMQASANTLGVEHAYKVIKMKSAIRKAAQTIIDQREAIVKEYLTDEERQKLGTPDGEQLKEKVEKASQCIANLLGEETDIECKSLPFAEWHKFCAENSLKLGVLELELEGSLWEAPEGSE